MYWRSLGLPLSIAILIVGVVSANDRPPATDVFNVVDWLSPMNRWLVLTFTLGIVNEKGASELCEYGIVTMISAFAFGSYEEFVVEVVDDDVATVGGMSSASIKSSSSMPHNFITLAKSSLPVLVTGADCVGGAFNCTAAVVCIVGVAFFFVAFDFFGFFAGFVGFAVGGTAGVTLSTTGFV